MIGEEELSPLDRQVLDFGAAFEQQYVNQGEAENRTVEETLDLAWRVAGVLPRSELLRLTDAMLDRYYRPGQGVEAEEGPSDEPGGDGGADDA